jgi:hypothetical protein
MAGKQTRKPVIKPKWLERGLINGPYLTLCTSYEEYVAVSKSFRDHSISPPFSKSGRCEHFYYDNKFVVIVTIQGMLGRTLAECIGLIVHESSHAADAFFESLGETYPSAEFKAYTIQALSQILIEEFISRVNLNKALDVISIKEKK